MALADVLDMPLRERNALLLAAGCAPRCSQTDLAAPSMAGGSRAGGVELTVELFYAADAATQAALRAMA